MGGLHGSVDNESVIHSIAHKLGETSASASAWERLPNGTREVDITVTGINECGRVNATRFNPLHLPPTPPPLPPRRRNLCTCDV